MVLLTDKTILDNSNESLTPTKHSGSDVDPITPMTKTRAKNASMQALIDLSYATPKTYSGLSDLFPEVREYIKSNELSPVKHKRFSLTGGFRVINANFYRKS